MAHDHIGILSITSNSSPLPKLRVTNFSCARPAEQFSQSWLDDIDRDDEEPAVGAKLRPRVTSFAASSALAAPALP